MCLTVYSAKNKSARSCISTPPYAFMACYLFQHREYLYIHVPCNVLYDWTKVNMSAQKFVQTLSFARRLDGSEFRGGM